MSSMFHKGIVYDAFLSYHESDREWVTEDLLKILEDNGLSVCWDIRDFEPGKTVIENKLHALCSSACTLVVLTPNYVTSEALWNILNEECGIDKKEIYTQFNLVPILLVQCRVPDVFVPLWKIDLTNNAVKMFFGKKLVQTVKKFVDDIKSNDCESQPRLYAKGTSGKEAEEVEINGNLIISEDHERRRREDEGSAIQELNSSYDSLTLNHDHTAQTGELKDTSQELEMNESASYQDESMGDRKCQGDDVTIYDDDLSDVENNARELATNFVENESISNVFNENVTEQLNDDKENRLLEKMHPRIISLFVPEDDDLTRQDIEDLTFKVEDIPLCHHPLESEQGVVTNENAFEDPVETFHQNLPRRRKNLKTENFGSQQEQISVLDSLQEKEMWFRRKFEKCTENSRKRIYRRLLEIFDKAICSTVNGEKDAALLACLPLSDLSIGESRGYSCSCCDQLFHSERALHLHIVECVKEAWRSILENS